MRLHSPIPMSSSSLFRLIALPAFLKRRSHDRHFQRARSMMLMLLESREGERVSRTRQRVWFAQDMESLWYLRQDVVLALGEFEGDEMARQMTTTIDGAFQGCLPSAMAPRPHRRSCLEHS